MLRDADGVTLGDIEFLERSLEALAKKPRHQSQGNARLSPHGGDPDAHSRGPASDSLLRPRALVDQDDGGDLRSRDPQGDVDRGGRDGRLWRRIGTEACLPFVRRFRPSGLLRRISRQLCARPFSSGKKKTRRSEGSDGRVCWKSFFQRFLRLADVAEVEAAGIAGHLGREARNGTQTSYLTVTYEKSCVPCKTRFCNAIRSNRPVLSDPFGHASTKPR